MVVHDANYTGTKYKVLKVEQIQRNVVSSILEPESIGCGRKIV